MRVSTHPALQVLDTQRDAWNAGSLAGYLAACAPDVVYVTARGPTFGREALAATMGAAWPDPAGMGTLDLEVLTLAAAGDPETDGASATVTLRWTVTGSGASKAGYALVVLGRRDGRWWMTHDATIAG